METIDPTLASIQQEALQLRQAGRSFTEISQQLTEQQMASQAVIESVISELKHQYYLKCRNRGLICVAIGAALCGFGFLITFIQWQTGEPAPWALYGFTGVGATLVMYGGVQIMGFWQ